MLSISASEGRRDYSLTPKSLQTAHILYDYRLVKQHIHYGAFFQVIDKIIKSNIGAKALNPIST